ncbi:MAG: EI24 domain-containing protein [Bacteroidia bacterium]|nr:EI24 domain-containing protein [Bacteroidia bacterium]NNF31862.1 EI24 domain-containing protein [Flavobacteriaceae bacterium]NNJ82691.1 EI24 domain-containing protein [Flavobacteriaceae bacterium]NNK53038.1 EI24 domain-containing protein [Flavobacteriaceae bacterium]NNM07759.1 EI24 domain-containing protein [Flavobacteriaceae bacterium]
MLKNIIKGLRAYGGTFKLISQLGLWKYFGVPILISVLTAIGIGFAAYGFSDNIGGLISRAWIWDWGSETFRTISDILGGIMIVTLGLILYKHIVMALSAPFMSPVSEKIEAHLTGMQRDHRKTSFMAQLWRGIKVNGRNLLMELFLSILIFIIGFIPIIGVISTVLLFLVQSYYAGFGNMDYTLERHFGYSKSIRFVSDHRGLAIGNGIVFILMLFIPVLGIIFVLPLSVTAATTETVKVLYPSEK